MFNPTELVIEAFVERLEESYLRTYGVQNPHYPGIISFIGRISLENIAVTDAAYHDLDHTILVTDVGLDVMPLTILGGTPSIIPRFLMVTSQTKL
jgi:hypothetical protein